MSLVFSHPRGRTHVNHGEELTWHVTWQDGQDEDDGAEEDREIAAQVRIWHVSFLVTLAWREQQPLQAHWLASWQRSGFNNQLVLLLSLNMPD